MRGFASQGAHLPACLHIKHNKSDVFNFKIKAPGRTSAWWFPLVLCQSWRARTDARTCASARWGSLLRIQSSKARPARFAFGSRAPLATLPESGVPECGAVGRVRRCGVWERAGRAPISCAVNNACSPPGQCAESCLVVQGDLSWIEMHLFRSHHYQVFPDRLSVETPTIRGISWVCCCCFHGIKLLRYKKRKGYFRENNLKLHYLTNTIYSNCSLD